MEKRLIVAISLSLLILLSWSAFVSKTQHIENKEVIVGKTEPIKTAPIHIETPVASGAQEDNTASLTTLANSNLTITFVDPIAAIKEVEFNSHHKYIFHLEKGLLLGSETMKFTKESATSDSVTFVHVGPTFKITKRFILHNSNNTIDLQVNVQSIANESIDLILPLKLGILDFSAGGVNSQYQDVAVATQDKTQHLNAQKNIEIPGVKFLAMRNRYYCGIVEPQDGNCSAFVRKLNGKKSEMGLNFPSVSLKPGQQWSTILHIYLGPQDLKIINNINPNWSSIIYYGTFDFISQILLQLLGFFYGIVHNWGWAIVLLSLAVYFILYPLTLKQMRSMKEMQILQPKIEDLRKLYKDNPQKMNKEVMQLYKEHKVNPLGGCLPLLLQMPIFFALYQALMRSIALKGAGFLWIKDLSEPDRLFLLPVSLPVFGNEINILPIVMTIGMFIQQKFTMANATTAGAEQQKIMMIIMPLMFGLIFYKMPAGLVLYWFINSTLMLIYQIRISKSK